MARDKTGKFLPGESGNPATVFASGNPHRFQPGQSGNPTGKPRSRVQFEEAFVEAVTTQGTPEEAADLLWKAARAGEPWAVQNLIVRFWPTTQTLKIEAQHADTYDFSRLSSAELMELEKLLEGATGSQEPAGGDGAPELPEIR